MKSLLCKFFKFLQQALFTIDFYNQYGKQRLVLIPYDGPIDLILILFIVVCFLLPLGVE